MGLDLSRVPDVVKPLARPLTGGAFPEADVDGIIAEAQTMENLADLLAGIKAEDAGAVVRMLRGREWQGPAKEAFEQVFAALGGQEDAERPGSEEDLLDLLEQALRDEAASLREHGVRMQHTEWMIYASLALLGAVIVRLLVWIYVNGPAALALIQYNTLLTQMKIQTIRRLVMISMLKFAGIMGGLDFGVQAAQQIWGDREAGDFDLASLAMSLGSGALTGALFAGANAGLSRLLSREMVYAASEAELAVRDKIVAIGQSLYGQALLGGVSGTAGAVPGLALSGQLDASHLAYTFISGVAGGIDIPASARVSYLPMLGVAELADTPLTTPHVGTHPPRPPGGSSPPTPRAVENHPHAPQDGDTPPATSHDTTTLAQRPQPERHANQPEHHANAPIDRRPSEPGANLPQPHPNNVIVGEVTRRHDTLLPGPVVDRAAVHRAIGDGAVEDGAEHGGTPARPPQNLPAERAPAAPPAPGAPGAPGADTAPQGGLPRGSLLPATVPAIITAAPEGTEAAAPESTDQAASVHPRSPEQEGHLTEATKADTTADVTTDATADTTANVTTDATAGISRTDTQDAPGRSATHSSALPEDHLPSTSATERGAERTSPAGTHPRPSLPDTSLPEGLAGPAGPDGPHGFSPAADPRPRNVAEAAATVHRRPPRNGDTAGPDGPRPGHPHQDRPANRIERLLSGSPDATDPPPPAVPDEVLLTEGRRLAQRLLVMDDTAASARALALMSRAIGEPDPLVALPELAAELGLRHDAGALVELFHDALRHDMSPDTATDRAALVGILSKRMAADPYRWSGHRYQSRFGFLEATAAQARTLGLLIEIMGGPVTSTRILDLLGPVLVRNGIRSGMLLIPVVQAAYEHGYLPRGTTGNAAFHAGMELFRREDPYLWHGVLLADELSLTGLGDTTARMVALLNEVVTRSVDDGRETVHPLERLAGDTGQGRRVEQLARLAEDARAHGADLARAAGPQELTDLLNAHRARDPRLWDGLRIAAENDVPHPSHDEARALSRLAEITGSDRPSRLWVFDPLRRLAREAGLDHSVERLAQRAVEAQRIGFDLFGPVDRRQVLDALTGEAGRAAAARPQDPTNVEPGLHDLSPSAVREARQAAIHLHAEAQRVRHHTDSVLSRFPDFDQRVAAVEEQIASLEARVQAWQRWPDRPEVSFTRDFAAFRSAYERAVERADRGQEVIPYMLEDATASLAARDGGRGFGLEIEFDLTGTTPRQRPGIARALHEAGLTQDTRMHAYHTMQAEGYRSGRNGGRGLWRLEEDITVAGELVSPILYDEPATWENLRIACEIIRAHGGRATARTGGHVHVSTHDYDHIVENYTSVLNYAGHHTDTVFRLGHNPEREGHRGLRYCRPNEMPAGGYESIVPERDTDKDHFPAVNMAAMKGSSQDHIEFRSWDGSLDPAVIQAQVKVSLALVEAAFRTAALDHPPNRGRYDRLGTHAELLELDPLPDLTEQGSLSFRTLMDEIFWRAADKEQLTALFAVTRWVPAP